MRYGDALDLLQELNENGIGGAIFPDETFIARRPNLEYTNEMIKNSYVILLENMQEIAFVEEGLQWIELYIGLQKPVGIQKN